MVVLSAIERVWIKRLKSVDGIEKNETSFIMLIVHNKINYTSNNYDLQF